GLFCWELEPVGGEWEGRSHSPLEAQPAVVVLGIDQAGNRARGRDGPVADDAGVGNDVAFHVLVHGFSGGQGGGFAEVNEGGFAVVGGQKQEAASAQVAGD